MYNNDETLLEACKSGDMAAWAFFVNKYSRLMDISINARLGKYRIKLGDGDIEEIRQRALTSIWIEKRLESVRIPNSLPYWLSIVSGNEAIEFVRKKFNYENKHFSITQEGADSIEPVSDSASPLCDCIERESLSAIDSAINSLSDKEKIIAKLHLYDGMKYQDISKMLNIPCGTVSSYLKRAKEKLKGKLRHFR